MKNRERTTGRPENPPRLWLFTLQAPGFPPQRFTFEDAADAEGVRTHNFSRSTPLGHTSVVQAYVREDAAEDEVTEARGQADDAEQRCNRAENEATALRRENKRLREGISNASEEIHAAVRRKQLDGGAAHDILSPLEAAVAHTHTVIT